MSTTTTNGAGISRSPDYRGTPDDCISSHYDLSNDFYALFLDERRVYSCPIWAPGDTLERAQLRKLDWHIDSAGAARAARVLDVGCGWGAMLRRTREHGAQEAVGLTLSREQKRHIDRFGDPGIDVRLENWIDHRPERRYDAVISVGAFEHFARRELSREQKVAAYREYFKRCREWLPRGGRTSLQTIGMGDARPDLEAVAFARFIYRVIFPETELPRLSEILEASERLFAVRDVRIDSDDYIRTGREWLARLDRNADAAAAIVGQGVVDDYRHYCAGMVREYERSGLTLLRLAFEAV